MSFDCLIVNTLYHIAHAVDVHVVCLCVLQEEEVEVDSHTMVKSGSESAGTMRATGTMSDGAQTMIEHGSTMLESDLGTMVINSDEEDEDEDVGSMRSGCGNIYSLICFFFPHCNIFLFHIYRKSNSSTRPTSIFHGLL